MALSARQMLNLPPSTATPSNSTLIIIDAQNEYAQGALRVTNASSTRKVISQLLELYRSSSSSSASASAKGEGTRIVHVLHQVPDGAPIFTPGTDLAEEFEELRPKEGEKVVKKLHPSAFAETELDGLLKKDGGVEGKKVVLVGYMAHVCVSTTARDAARLGYDVLVVEDGVGDRDIPGATGEEVTKMVMHELGDFFATIVQSQDIK